MAKQEKPDPSPARISRLETFRVSSQSRRQNLLEAGKVELRVFVDPGTKATLQAIKETHNLPTLGAAADFLAKHTQTKK